MNNLNSVAYKNEFNLPQIKETNSEIKIYTDSIYVKNGITEWIVKWKENGWKNANTRKMARKRNGNRKQKPLHERKRKHKRKQKRHTNPKRVQQMPTN